MVHLGNRALHRQRRCNARDASVFPGPQQTPAWEDEEVSKTTLGGLPFRNEAVASRHRFGRAETPPMERTRHWRRARRAPMCCICIQRVANAWEVHDPAVAIAWTRASAIEPARARIWGSSLSRRPGSTTRPDRHRSGSHRRCPLAACRQANRSERQCPSRRRLMRYGTGPALSTISTAGGAESAPPVPFQEPARAPIGLPLPFGGQPPIVTIA
jgi:hypothetical protein